MLGKKETVFPLGSRCERSCKGGALIGEPVLSHVRDSGIEIIITSRTTVADVTMLFFYDREVVLMKSQQYLCLNKNFPMIALFDILMWMGEF